MTVDCLTSKIKACDLCSEKSEHGVNPVLQFHPDAKILIAGQAPGSKVHASGIPFDDASGERLRDWMGIDSATFYDQHKIAILPMAFCYPGKGKSGDLPPPPICADTWRERLLAQLANLELNLLIGKYAQAWHLPKTESNLTNTVRSWANNPNYQQIPLPHPSPRNNIWLKKNSWFEQLVLPKLRQRVADVLEKS